MGITIQSNGFNQVIGVTSTSHHHLPANQTQLREKTHIHNLSAFKNPKEQNNNMLTIYEKYLTTNRIN
jgi:hypothetical protein